MLLVVLDENGVEQARARLVESFMVDVWRVAQDKPLAVYDGETLRVIPEDEDE